MPNLSAAYREIKAKIQRDCPSVKFVSLWNQQVRDLENQKTWDFPFPAVLVEFVKPEKVGVLGNGVRIFEPLFIKFHIVSTFFNATTNGDFMEEDPGAFELNEELYDALSGFEPDGCVAMFSYSEEFDHDHDDIVHCICTYQTNFTDFDMVRPVGGVPWDSSPRVMDIIINPWGIGIIIQDDFGPLLQDDGSYLLW